MNITRCLQYKNSDWKHTILKVTLGTRSKISSFSLGLQIWCPARYYSDFQVRLRLFVSFDFGSRVSTYLILVDSQLRLQLCILIFKYELCNAIVSLGWLWICESSTGTIDAPGLGGYQEAIPPPNEKHYCFVHTFCTLKTTKKYCNKVYLITMYRSGKMPNWQSSKKYQVWRSFSSHIT